MLKQWGAFALLVYASTIASEAHSFGNWDLSLMWSAFLRFPLVAVLAYVSFIGRWISAPALTGAGSLLAVRRHVNTPWTGSAVAMALSFSVVSSLANITGFCADVLTGSMMIEFANNYVH